MGIPTEVRYISLFAGAGGLDLGIKLACPGARAICYVEIDAPAAAILATRLAEGSLDDAPVWSDICTFDGRPWRGLVDGIVGGFPCTDLSVAGKQEGIVAGNRSGLWFEYARLIREIQPRWVFIENVPPVLASPAGGIVLGELNACGCDAQWISLRASDVGAPHQRKRVFMLAYRRDARGHASHNQRRCGIGGTEAGVRQHGERGWRSAIADVDVAHAEHDGHDRPGGDAPEPSSNQPGERIPRGDCEPVADADGGNASAEREQRSGEQRQLAQDDGVGGIAVAGPGDGQLPQPLPLFPPGPGGRERWAAILREHPELAPAIGEEEIERFVRRVAAGTPEGLGFSRVDQLRALGNLVVPMQAALAFTVLLGRRKG